VSADVGGDPPCWAHLFADTDVAAGQAGEDRVPATVADLGSVDTTGRAGVVWSLPHGADLDASLVHLHPGGSIDSHVNDEVDIVISVIAGDGQLVVGGTSNRLRDLVVALIPKGERREIRAGSVGITYLSIHTRRSPLGITRRPTTAT
jgi:quercetin dioxygenase-like cupin family protein